MAEGKKARKSNELRLLTQAADAPLIGDSSAGSDLAKFAADVITLNRQAGLSPSSAMPNQHGWTIASLESLQRGPKMKRLEPAAPSEEAQVTPFRRLHKE